MVTFRHSPFVGFRFGVLFVLTTTALAVAAEPAWRMLEAPRFTVFSQLSDAKTRAWAEEFSQFAEEVVRMFTTGDVGLPPLTIVIFAKDRDFTPYKGLRPDGRAPRDIAGFFLRRETWSIVGMAGGYATDEIRQLIFHEGVHWAMSAYPQELPMWIKEGTAEVFSTFEQKGDKVRWGSAIDNHVLLLRQGNLLPLERLLFLTRSDPLFNESDRTSIFYAQSWLFVHYVLYGQHKGERRAIDDYLRGLAGGSAPDDAFRNAFGGDYRAMEGGLRKYLQGGRFVMWDQPAAASRLAGLAAVPAPPHRVEAARARLASGPDSRVLAASHADRAIELAPDQPEGYEARAICAYETEHPDVARQAAEKAVQLGSRDPGTMFLLAYLLTREAGSGGLWGQPARDVANLYHRVIELAPSMQAAYVNLAGLVGTLDKLVDADVVSLKQGNKRFPRNGDIVLGIAQMLAKVGEMDQAREVLKAARQRELSSGGADVAEDLERRWTFEAYMPRIEAFVREENYAGAIALYDELLPELQGTPNYASVNRARGALVTWLKVLEADAAARDGHTELARALYDEAIASQSLPSAQLRRAHEQRAKLDKAPAP